MKIMPIFHGGKAPLCGIWGACVQVGMRPLTPAGGTPLPNEGRFI